MGSHRRRTDAPPEFTLPPVWAFLLIPAAIVMLPLVLLGVVLTFIAIVIEDAVSQWKKQPPR